MLPPVDHDILHHNTCFVMFAICVIYSRLVCPTNYDIDADVDESMWTFGYSSPPSNTQLELRAAEPMVIRCRGEMY